MFKHLLVCSILVAAVLDPQRALAMETAPVPPWATAKFRSLGSGTIVSDLADNGRAICGTRDGAAIRWTETEGITHVPLSTWYYPAGTTFGATGISRDGTVVTGNIIYGGSTLAAGATLWQQAWKWTVSSPAPQILPFESSSHGISSSGSRVIGRFGNPATQFPFYWIGDSVVLLDDDASADVHGISAAGTVIVGESGGVPMRWVTGLFGYVTKELLVPLWPEADGAANAVSDDGHAIVGWSEHAWHGGKVATRWLSGAHNGTSLGFPSPGTSATYDSTAYDISPDGLLVAGAAWKTSGGAPRGATVWVAEKGTRWLKDVLAAHGLADELAGWQLQSAVGVTSDASFVYFAGNGLGPAGQIQGWWARVPKPLK